MNGFIAIRIRGEYEDRTETPCAVSLDKSTIENFINEQKEWVTKHNLAVDALNQLSIDWWAAHPLLSEEQCSLVIPKWINIRNQDITVEMRAERVRLQTENDRRRADHQAYVAQHRLPLDRLQAEFIAQHKLEVADHWNPVPEKIQENWEISEVPFL